MIDINTLIATNRAGTRTGLPCFCTANEHVLRAVLDYAAQTKFPTVIEATCNQVNQDGGYTGMTPRDFMHWVKDMAREHGVPMSQLILGGDHLGPNPWRDQPIDIAMRKAREMVRLYVEAGFTKIHLDASMACGGEPNPTFAQIAERAADLCSVAEKYAPDATKLFYIIGTEVPIPGGETEEPDTLDVTSTARFQDTIATHCAAWNAQGLSHAWDRIVGIVTQPGVDFGHTSIYPFIPPKARDLSHAILNEPNVVFEAHSTDYQTTTALSELVEHNFFFLKVGPELTFRFREAIFALAAIQRELDASHKTDLRDVIETKMIDSPKHWAAYYDGTDAQQKQLRKFSYSDRIRYYWTDPQISRAVSDLLQSPAMQNLPETVVSQYFSGLEFGEIPTKPNDLVNHHIKRCIARYFDACGYNQTSSGPRS